MTEDTCPICDEPIEAFERRDVVTYELVPCGHHVDAELREELTVGTE